MLALPGMVPRPPGDIVVWVETPEGYAPLASEEERRARLRDHLADESAAAVARYGLTAEEAGRLRLAGRGDVERLLRRMEEATREERAAHAAGDHGRLAEAGRRHIAIRRTYARPFGEGSLFAKVLAKILAERLAAGEPDPVWP